MERLKYLVIEILALFLAGCGGRGQIVEEKLNVIENPVYNAPGSGKGIVILPLADYSQGNLESAQRRNMFITESLTDNLVTQGFALPIQEDVIAYLSKEDLIDTANTSSLAMEQKDEWSPEMKAQLKIYQDQMGSDNSPGTHGLSKQTVAKIGKHFKTNYVLRGRILEFKGSGTSDPEATVEIRVWVQDAANGDVVWTNRAKVAVAPESKYSDLQYDTLSNTAIEQGVITLVDNFVKYGL
jgi:hypothetical protein